MPKKIDSKYLILLVSVTILAAILRLVAVGRDSLWFDEAISYLLATHPVGEIISNSSQDPHPPLYYLFLHFWLLVIPGTDTAARSLNILMNVLLAPSIYWLTKILFDRRSIAFWAALLVAVSPFQVLYSQELRMYSQVMLLLTLAVVAFLCAERTDNWIYWFNFELLSALAVYSHLFSWFVLAAIGVYSIVRHRLEQVTRRIILLYAVLITLFVPWLVTILDEVAPELGSMRPLLQQNIFNPIKPLTAFSFIAFGMSSSFIYSGFAFFLILSVVIIFVLEVRKAKLRKENEGLLLPVLIVIWVIGFPVAVYLIRPYFLPERTLAAASPFLMIIFAWGTSRKGSPLPYLVYITVGVMFVGTLMYLTGPPVKPPYRDVIAFVKDNYKSGDVVLHTSDGSYLPALRYASLNNHAVLAGDPDPRKPAAVYEILGGEIWNKDDVTIRGNRLWLIVALEHSVEWQKEQAAFFREHYTLLKSNEIGGIQVYLYDLLHPITAK